MYWAGDKAQMLRGLLDRMAPDRDRMKRQVKWFLDTLNIMCLNKTLPLHLIKVHFTWYGRFITHAWPGTNIHLSYHSPPGPTGSSEWYHEECPEAHGWHTFLPSPWGHRLFTTSGKWDRIHEDQRNEEDGWDSVHVLPCFHQDSACPGQIYCFMTWTLQEKEVTKKRVMNPKNVKAQCFVKVQKFKSLWYIGCIINKADTYRYHTHIP